MKKLKILLSYNYFFILASVLIIIFLIFKIYVVKYRSVYENGESSLEGKIVSYNIDGDKLSLEIKTKEKIKANYYFETEEEKNDTINKLCVGCTIYLKGSLKEANNNTVPNTFNYKRYLYYKKIYKIMNIESFKIKKDNAIWYKIKDYLNKRCNTLKNADYLKIFILGDKSLIASEEYSLYQENGVAHLLAISGMHIGVILKILDNLLSQFSQKKKYIIISSVLLFYAFLTSFSASIMRAVLFYIILNLIRIFALKISNIKALIYTCYLLLLINPFYLFDVGFIYSFVITGGIILAHDFLKGNYFMQMFKLSIISFIVCLPITASLNYEVNLTSIFANIIFVPFVSLILYPVCLIYFICPFIEQIFTFLINILKLLNNLFASFSILITIPKIAFIIIILYYVIYIIALKRPKVILASIFLLIINYIIPKLDSNGYVYYVDVGQGDCAIVIDKYQREVDMIDTGGSIDDKKDNWQEKVKSYAISDNTIKFLKSLGITKINNLVISHGDEDHGGEIFNIAQNFKIKNIILNNNESSDLEKNIRNNFKISPYIVSRFNIVNLNNEVYDNENDNSIVLYFTINKYNFLFLGDISKNVEDNIISNNKLKVDFLKIAHHGSKNSSSEEFIKNLDFKLGIISCGRNNRYGHPHKETIDTLNKYHKNYVTTAEYGTIKIEIGTNNYTIYNYEP